MIARRPLVLAATLLITASLGCRRDPVPDESARDSNGANTPPSVATGATGPADNPAATASPTPPSAHGMNLLLLTLDTTRADALGCYGGQPDVTPNLDALAARGTRFANAFSQANVTNPTHLTIMSGLCALDHNVFGVVERMDPDIQTLPRLFQAAGYRTGAFIAVKHLFEMGWRGFDNRNMLVPPQRRQREALAHRVTDAAIAWLTDESPADKPFFLWVHYFDAHMRYDPPRDALESLLGPDHATASRPATPPRQFFKPPADEDFVRGISRDEWRDAQARYAGEVHFMDREIGRLLRYLDENALTPRTVVMAIADHGESLGEHGIFYDHIGIFEPQLRIPFIVHVPGLPAANIVQRPVTQLDVAPTVAGLFGLTFSRDLEGVDLSDSLAGRTNPALDARDTLIHEAAQNLRVAVRQGRWKLIAPVKFAMKPIAPHLKNMVQLFDLEVDPDERNNLAKSEPQVRKRLVKRIKKWRDRGIATAKPRDAEQADRLRDLGYLGDDD
jgi:arylsulfatase A-like enzyme